MPIADQGNVTPAKEGLIIYDEIPGAAGDSSLFQYIDGSWRMLVASPAVANIQMNAYKIINLDYATAPLDATNLSQVQTLIQDGLFSMIQPRVVFENLAISNITPSTQTYAEVIFLNSPQSESFSWRKTGGDPDMNIIGSSTAPRIIVGISYDLFNGRSTSATFACDYTATINGESRAFTSSGTISLTDED